MSNKIRENYKDIVSSLHEIVESEMMGKGDPIEMENCIRFITAINSFGLISAEVSGALLDKFSSDIWFRHVWGSIATQFEWELETRFDIRAFEISNHLMGIMNFEDRFREEGCLTSPDLAAPRVGIEDLDGKSLNDINDFWLVCLMIFRLTISKSEIVSISVARQFEEKSPSPKKN